MSKDILRVGIVGAGVSGLTLAGLLARSTRRLFQVDIFDKHPREHVDHTPLSASPEALQTLTQAGVDYKAFLSDSTDVKFLCHTHKPTALVALFVPFLARPFFPPSAHLNRNEMKYAFLHALKQSPTTTVHFSTPVGTVRKGADGVAEVIAEQGDEVLGEYDVVVDTSGTHSPLRKLRVRYEDPATWYTGFSYVHGLIHNVDTTCPPSLSRMLGTGSLIAPGAHATMFSLQRYGRDGQAAFFFTFPAHSSDALHDDFDLPKTMATSSEALNKVRVFVRNAMGDGWCDEYHRVIDALDAASVRPYLQHTCTPDLDLTSDLPLVCIGDSLHTSMPLVQLETGKLAIDDAAKLAKALEEEGPIELQTLRHAELDAMVRAEPTMATVVRNLDKLRGAIDSETAPQNDIDSPVVTGIMSLVNGWYAFETALGLQKSPKRTQ